MDGAEPVNIGVSRAYTGSTTEGIYSSFSGGLAGSYIGSQKMTDQLFILSVDEAFKYREWLWRFDGAKEENPESQYCLLYTSSLWPAVAGAVSAFVISAAFTVSASWVSCGTAERLP